MSYVRNVETVNRSVETVVCRMDLKEERDVKTQRGTSANPERKRGSFFSLRDLPYFYIIMQVEPEASKSETLEDFEHRLIGKLRESFVKSAIEDEKDNAAQQTTAQELVAQATTDTASTLRARYDPIWERWSISFTPQNDEQWRDMCLARWEDSVSIRRDDPFWRRHRETVGQDTWEAFHAFMDENERYLLNVSSSYICVQRLVRRLAGGQKAQDFQDVFTVGCTRTHAILAGSVLANPDEFHLHVLRIDDAAPPRTDMVRRKPLAADSVNNYDIERSTEKAFETPLEEVEPAWDVVNNSRIPGPPEMSALDPVSGNLVLVCRNTPDRAQLFRINREGAERPPSVKLPCADPAVMAISSKYLAVGYTDATGQPIADSPQRVPLPPHVYVYNLETQAWLPVPYLPIAPADDESEEQQQKRATDEDAATAQSKKTRTQEPPQKTVMKFSCLEFHRSRPETLLVGTSKGGMVLCDVTALERREPAPHHGRILYPGPNLMQIYEAFCHRAESISDAKAAEELLYEMPAPAREKVWFMRWQDYEPIAPGVEPDTRLLLGLESSMVIINGTEKSTRDKRERLGKRPLAFEPRETPMLSMEAHGGVLALHDAVHNELIIGELMRLRPCWKFSHPDVLSSIPAIGRPYPSLALFSKRMVILWPNGFVGFVEVADKVMQEKYAAERQRNIIEKLNELNLRDKKPDSAAAKDTTTEK